MPRTKKTEPKKPKKVEPDHPVWKETFDFFPPGGKRYRKVRLEADHKGVRIKVGRETITLTPLGDEAFVAHLRRALDAQRTLRHIAEQPNHGWSNIQPPRSG